MLIADEPTLVDLLHQAPGPVDATLGIALDALFVLGADLLAEDARLGSRRHGRRGSRRRARHHRGARHRGGHCRRRGLHERRGGRRRRRRGQLRLRRKRLGRRRHLRRWRRGGAPRPPVREAARRGATPPVPPSRTPSDRGRGRRHRYDGRAAPSYRRLTGSRRYGGAAPHLGRSVDGAVVELDDPVDEHRPMPLPSGFVV